MVIVICTFLYIKSAPLQWELNPRPPSPQHMADVMGGHPPLLCYAPSQRLRDFADAVKAPVEFIKKGDHPVWT